MARVDLKIVLLGKHSVGKTCMVERYLHGSFKENTVATVGAAFAAKKVSVRGRDLTLGIWDTAGQERYESMSRIYYRSAGAAIICWDMQTPSTYQKVGFWVDELKRNEPDCVVYIVGTKADCKAEDDPELRSAREAAREFADDVGGMTFETSSKTGEQVEELFTAIAEAHVEALGGGVDGGGAVVDGGAGAGGGGLGLDNRPPPKSKCCG